MSARTDSGELLPLFTAAVLSLLAGLTTLCRAEPVAMATDVTGKVFAAGAKSGITILADIEADARVQLEAGARLVAIYLKSGDEYAVSGPALIQFKANEPVAVSGGKPQKRANPLAKSGQDIRIKPGGVTQAAYVMRSGGSTTRIKLLSLSGTRTLDLASEFRWQEIEPGTRYHFELTDSTGKTLHETETGATSLKLPASVQLREGVAYIWEVSARPPDGRRYVGSGDFSIAAAELRARVEALRPAPASPVSHRVTFAAWLDQMELKDEARKYWKALATERPDDSRLRALAAEQ